MTTSGLEGKFDRRDLKILIPPRAGHFFDPAPPRFAAGKKLAPEGAQTVFPAGAPLRGQGASKKFPMRASGT
ncbi:MAG: hypothetical protein A2Z43_01310 [Syntrophobacterales bacterium RBG_19FT_COMBO_59_10]|nr:MAG: hypothetical protein A2Z43_01310 [Syntrophobacterales bacterium RBG_19FT_COMBO_59_10]